MYKIQEIFHSGFQHYGQSFQPSAQQSKAADSIMRCKSGKLGVNIRICKDCEYTETHNNSCRNRHCPCCQGVLKELWLDERRTEVVDAPYFHAVFPMPAELRPLIYQNQKLLYDLMHQCVSATLLELSRNKKYLDATPGLIQILHTWGQKLNYHPHIHCIITGGGLTKARQWKHSRSRFFLPLAAMKKLFRGKFLYSLDLYWNSGKLNLPQSLGHLDNPRDWKAFCGNLYSKDWCPYIKETFNGFGNALDYLGKYTHRIAISNTRIQDLTDSDVTFSARDYKTKQMLAVTISHQEFVRRFLMHVLPKGFQKIRYYGFLNNRFKRSNLKLISKLTARQLYKAKYRDLPIEGLLLTLYQTDIRICPCCGGQGMRPSGRTYPMRN